jgi:hypothetical protein
MQLPLQAKMLLYIKFCKDERTEENPKNPGTVTIG